MMQYKNTKSNVRSPDVDTDFFNIVAGVPQEDALALYLLIICLDDVLRMSIDLMKEKGKGKKQKISRMNDYRRGLRW